MRVKEQKINEEYYIAYDHETFERSATVVNQSCREPWKSLAILFQRMGSAQAFQTIVCYVINHNNPRIWFLMESKCNWFFQVSRRGHYRLSQTRTQTRLNGRLWRSRSVTSNKKAVNVYLSIILSTDDERKQEKKMRNHTNHQS